MLIKRLVAVQVVNTKARAVFGVETDEGVFWCDTKGYPGGPSDTRVYRECDPPNYSAVADMFTWIVFDAH